MEDGSWTRDLPAVQNCVMEDGWIRVDVRRRRHQRVPRSVRRLQLLDRRDVPAVVDPCPRRVALDSDRPCGNWRFCLRCAQADLVVEDTLACCGDCL
jgi:hypothetical protein